jgi:uncharacterized protein YjbI with pentapeptide repeats
MGANFPVQRRPTAGDRESAREGDGGEARLWHIGTALAVSFTVAVVGLVGLAWLAWVLLGVAGFRRHGPPALHDTVGILQLVFASVAGAGALVALIVAYRRQKVAEADSAHDRTRVFNERFTTIAAQLGDAQPAVRLAGVHAMAGLADDWKANRQTCIDVLCAYLRLPYEPDPGEEAPAPERLAFRASREVRHTVIRVITAHLSGGAAVSWRGLKFDFTGVVFDGGSFYGAEFTGAVLSEEGAVSFADAEFTGGTVDFRHVKFTGAPVSFRSAKFTGGTVDFGFAGFSGGMVHFADAQFTGSTVSFGYARVTGALVYFNYAKFTGGTVDFQHAQFTGGIVCFDRARVTGGTVSFRSAQFTGGKVDFFGAEFTGGRVIFGGAEFTGGTVHFGAQFTGSKVIFAGAEFTGGTVDFRSAQFTGGTVSFGGAQFTGGTIHFGAEFTGGRVGFGGAQFTGGMVDFGGAEFTGGMVDFGNSLDWSHPPRFDWNGKPAAG